MQARDDAAEAEQQRRERCGDEGMAWRMSKDLVKQRLASPATADFPWLDRQAHSPACGKWVVRSHVDSQNGFGAMLRTHFIATVRRVGERRWVLESFVTS